LHTLSENCEEQVLVSSRLPVRLSVSLTHHESTGFDISSSTCTRQDFYFGPNYSTRMYGLVHNPRGVTPSVTPKDVLLLGMSRTMSELPPPQMTL
jgi:hypothetical protein